MRNTVGSGGIIDKITGCFEEISGDNIADLLQNTGQSLHKSFGARFRASRLIPTSYEFCVACMGVTITIGY